eukprot:CAMPEP_0114506358 /NCGR_PEP_ID=MMETSP0109-20121206/11385_1 /TAXON_ID=29199 /ORGANISM="Chlorarachnion reptans, Strain CCCM449" /LENGTH=732 /DNA_ID=CAMNT_0001684941 /DNA_START=785 /DNA_END=2980 /DNA_ORIENTATION=+
MPGSILEIKCRTLEEKEFSINVDETDTIGNLKEKIEAKEPNVGPHKKVVLVYDGTVLEDNMTVGQCNIDPFAAKRVIVFEAKDPDFVQKAPFLARTWDMEAKAAEAEGNKIPTGGGISGAGGAGLPRIPGLGGINPEQLAQNPMMQQLILAAMQQPGFGAQLRQAMLQQAARQGSAELKARIDTMSDEEIKAKVMQDLTMLIGASGGVMPGGGGAGIPMPFPGGGGGGGLGGRGFPPPGFGGQGIPGLPGSGGQYIPVPIPGGGGSGVPATPAPGPDADDGKADPVQETHPGLAKARNLLDSVFPYADSKKDGFIDAHELAAFFKKTAKGKNVSLAMAEKKAKEFFIMAQLNGCRPGPKGISRKEWVNFQMGQFKQLAEVVPPDQFESELRTALNAYEHMLETFKKEESANGDVKNNRAAEKEKANPGPGEKGTGDKKEVGENEKTKKVVTRKNWLPLESDPVPITRYMEKLGIDAKKWQFHDVFDLSPQGTMHIPTPILAVMLLFPLSEQSEKIRKEQEEKIKSSNTKPPTNVYHVKQTVGNACGTIALLHAVMNNVERMKPEEGKFFAKFLKETKEMNASERAAALGESKDLEEQHEVVAREGKTKATAREFANLHFIAFVKVDEVLYELDGRKSQPITHGKTSGASFLEDALKVVRGFMALTPQDRRYNVIVLAPQRQSGWGQAGPGGVPNKATGGAPSPSRQQESIAQLVGMGISADKAREALEKNGW